jgi:hypothetical protein
MRVLCEHLVLEGEEQRERASRCSAIEEECSSVCP